jgi:hypothetical protein
MTKERNKQEQKLLTQRSQRKNAKVAEENKQRQTQTQIPFGNDKQKGMTNKGNDKQK